MSVYLGGPAQNVLVAKWPYEMAAAMMVKTKKKFQQNSAYEMAALKPIARPFNGIFKGHKLLSGI